MNHFAHTSHTPYELADEIGRIGCYEDLYTAKGIGRSKLANREIKTYTVRDLNGNIVDQD